MHCDADNEVSNTSSCQTALPICIHQDNNPANVQTSSHSANLHPTPRSMRGITPSGTVQSNSICCSNIVWICTPTCENERENQALIFQEILLLTQHICTYPPTPLGVTLACDLSTPSYLGSPYHPQYYGFKMCQFDRGWLAGVPVESESGSGIQTPAGLILLFLKHSKTLCVIGWLKQIAVCTFFWVNPVFDASWNVLASNCPSLSRLNVYIWTDANVQHGYLRTLASIPDRHYLFWLRI